MGLSSRWPYAPVLIVGALLLFGSVLVGACDLLTGSTLGTGDNSGSPVPDSATLAHDHMPTGTSLPSPSDVPVRNGTVQAYEDANESPEAIQVKSDSSGADSSSVESPYGCYLASRPYTDAVRFRSVYLYFPESMVEAAGNETEREILSLQAVSVEDSSAVVGNLEEAVEQRDRTGVRFANCVIPAASGARSLASEQLLRVGEDKAAWNALAASEDTASKAAAYQQQCTVQEVTTCAGWPGNQSCGTDYELDCSSSVPGAGDDGDGGPSDGGDGDGGYPGGGSGSSGGDGDGNNDEDCLHNPQPGSNGDPCDPCESANPPSYCDPCESANPPSYCDSDDECESANPPSWCDLGCKLSSSDLVDGYYLYDQASEDAKTEFINTLEEHGSNYGLDSKEDVRHFIAQTAHESQGAITKVENLNYQDAENLAATFSEFSIDGKAGKYKASDYTGKPQEIAKIAYAGRLGNGEKGSGDAYKYRGRGPMQITGKDNYQAFTDEYQNEGFGTTDFVVNPGKLSSDAEVGTHAALWYWDENVLGSDQVNEDSLTVEDVTEAINGGDTGLDIREDHFEKAKDIDCNN